MIYGTKISGKSQEKLAFKVNILETDVYWTAPPSLLYPAK